MKGMQEKGDKGSEAMKDTKKEGEGLKCKRNHFSLNVKCFYWYK
jgi:hypothetical protein